MYSGDRIRSHRQLPRWLLPLATLTGCLGTIACAIAAPVLIAPLAALGVISLAYPLLKRIPALKAVIVGLSWCVAIALLPIHGDWSILASPSSWAVALLVTAGVIACDLKDRDRDRDRGIKTLPVLLGMRGACIAAALCATAGGSLAYVDQHGLLVATTVPMLVLTAIPTLLSRPLLGPISVDLALTLPSFIALLL